MKNFKKLSALLCVIIIIFTTATVGAVPSRCNCGHSPVVMISGFGATALSLDGEVVFPPSADTLKGLLSKHGMNIGKGLLGFLVKNDIDEIGPHLIALVEEIIEPIRMNPDGTSYYDVKPVVSGAKDTSLKAFRENGMLSFVPYTGSEFLDMEMIAEKIGDDHVFNFTYDWRLSNDEVADGLLSYIEEVMELTGHDKVSVYSISQGSLLFGQYLYKYADKGYIDNSVFDTPLLTGSDLVSDIVTEQEISLNADVLLSLLSAILHTETDLTFLSSLFENETLKFVIDYGAKNVVVPVVLYAPAFWEMLTGDGFEHYKEVYLDKDENEKLLTLVENVQNGFKNNVSETLHKAEDYGASVAIKSSYGYPLFSGTYQNSDGVVNVTNSCGALTAPYGETFSASYKQAVADKKYSISPDRTVDLSTGFYPERTWMVSELFHGQVEWDKPSLKLVCELLLTDNIRDAYSHYEYPQFMTGQMPNSDVSVVFDCTNSGFLAYGKGGFCKDTMTLTNTSLSDAVVIKKVETANGTLSVKNGMPMYLAAGQSVTLDFESDADVFPVYDSIRITYTTVGFSAKENTADFPITVLENYGGAVNTDIGRKDYTSNIFTDTVIFLTLMWEKFIGLFR